MEYLYTALLLYETGTRVDESTMTAVLEAAGARPEPQRARATIAALHSVELDELRDRGVERAGWPDEDPPDVAHVDGHDASSTDGAGTDVANPDRDQAGATGDVGPEGSGGSTADVGSEEGEGPTGRDPDGRDGPTAGGRQDERDGPTADGGPDDPDPGPTGGDGPPEEGPE